MIKKIEGMVISERTYNDSSKIIQVLTPDLGSIDILAKGAKGLKSPLRNGTQKLIRGYFYVYYKEDKLSTLTNVDIIDYYKEIHSNIEKISYASYLLDLSNQIMKQNKDERIYHLLIDTLTKIEQGFSSDVLTMILELKYLDYLGVRPIIDACSICGSQTNIATLSSEKGGYICHNCITNEIRVSQKAIKLVRLFYYVDISKISKLEISEEVKKELNRFIDNYYERYTGLFLRTKTFLRNLGKLT